ncbi:MAG: hypothetical protein ACXVLQ_12330 [Bacteriovorax sp.]
MKFIISLFALLLITSAVHADDQFNGLDNSYERASIPNFLPYVGKALPGRCYLAKGSNKKIASVLMVSFEEEGFEVAPFDGEKKSEDFFDNMSYEDVLKQFPIIKKMFLNVNETADGAVIYKNLGTDEYRSELRESEKYLILRVFINNKIYKYCNYVKVD